MEALILRFDRHTTSIVLTNCDTCIPGQRLQQYIYGPDGLRVYKQDVKSIPTKQQPIVFGQWLHAKGLPTVLIYGHYDVQPVDPLELWHTQPFNTQLVNGEFLGRGVNDDKGGLLQPIQAIEALLQSEGKLPVNVKVQS